MSPRSQEYMNIARDRLAAAEHALEGGFAGAAVSAAYYSVLNAARAALSERERYSKTHSGVWSLFNEVFVRSGSFDAARMRSIARMQELREASDYAAEPVSSDLARKTIADAQTFVDAVAALIGD